MNNTQAFYAGELPWRSDLKRYFMSIDEASFNRIRWKIRMVHYRYI